MNRVRILPVLCLLVFASKLLAEGRVMIVSIDGLRPDCALRADMPNLRSLMADGSFTFWCYTTPAAVTLPSHTSMVTGVVIEKHGISGNDDNAAANQPIKVPTIFDLAKKQNISSGMSAGKSKFSIYSANGSIDFPSSPAQKTLTSEQVADNAVKILSEHQPRLMFVHFPEVDATGHGKGWGTREQIAAIERTDKALGTVLGELDRLNLRDKTTIILSADHGGSGKQHGKDDDRSRFIPWIITGPGIKKNVDLSQYRELKIQTYDTFATACKVLEIPTPDGIDGKPIVQAFETTDLMNAPATQPATRPVTSVPQTPAAQPVLYADANVPTTQPWIGVQRSSIDSNRNGENTAASLDVNNRDFDSVLLPVKKTADRQSP